MVSEGKVPTKGAVFGNDLFGYLDYEGVKMQMRMNTPAGQEAARTLIDGVFGEEADMFKTPKRPPNSGLILP